ncbi:MAG: sugar O-acetyltransferase [Hyphomicrobiales bacterium]
MKTANSTNIKYNKWFSVYINDVKGHALKKIQKINNYIKKVNNADINKANTIIKNFIKMGGNNIIIPPFYCSMGNVELGRHTKLGSHCFFWDVAEIVFGEHVWVGPNCCFYTTHHPMDAERRKAGYVMAKPIKIGDSVWLGGSVVVCPGVSIGDNTVVGAGSVVTKNIPANVLAAGNPCKVIRKLETSKTARGRVGSSARA